MLKIDIKSLQNLVFIFPVGVPIGSEQVYRREAFAKGSRAEKYLTVCESSRQLPDYKGREGAVLLL